MVCFLQNWASGMVISFARKFGKWHGILRGTRVGQALTGALDLTTDRGQSRSFVCTHRELTMMIV